MYELAKKIKKIKETSEENGYKCMGLFCEMCTNADRDGNCLRYKEEEIGITAVKKKHEA